MKKLFICVSAAILSGCAMGINHNVATVNGKTYLIESKQRNLLYITQWTYKSNISVLDEDDLIRKTVVSKFDSILTECKQKSPQEHPQIEKIHKCVVEKFHALDK